MAASCLLRDAVTIGPDVNSCFEGEKGFSYQRRLGIGQDKAFWRKRGSHIRDAGEPVCKKHEGGSRRPALRLSVGRLWLFEAVESDGACPLIFCPQNGRGETHRDSSFAPAEG